MNIFLITLAKDLPMAVCIHEEEKMPIEQVLCIPLTLELGV